LEIREEAGSNPRLNFCMEKIELTKEQIMYIATYLEEELETQPVLPEKLDSALHQPPFYCILEGAIDAFNGGAR
jgi:hypothetical protein